MPQSFAQAVRPFIPTIRDFFQALPLLLGMFVYMLLTGQAGAQTVDSVLGTEVTSKGCSLVNSIEKSIFLKLFCGAILLWGIIKFIPTRKDGVGQMLAGVIGFLVLSKFTTLTGVFGMKCG